MNDVSIDSSSALAPFASIMSSERSKSKSATPGEAPPATPMEPRRVAEWIIVDSAGTASLP